MILIFLVAKFARSLLHETEQDGYVHVRVVAFSSERVQMSMDILLQALVGFGLNLFDLEPIGTVNLSPWQCSGMHPAVHEPRSTIVSFFVGRLTLG